MHPDALAAVRAGRAGVHVVYRGHVYDAIGVNGAGVTLRTFDRSRIVDADPSECVALERTYTDD